MAQSLNSKKLSSEPIVFLGTGPVAAKCLSLLIGSFNIEAVITKPQPKHHKEPMPVLEVSKKNYLNVIEVQNKHDLDSIVQEHDLSSQLGLLIDFGIIISEAFINYFPLGIINSHFSILPELRGPDPITFAILSGQKTTGVSLMKIVPAMDEGPIFSWKEIQLSSQITEPELTDKLIEISDQLIKDFLPRIITNQIQPTKQDKTGKLTSYTHKLTKSDSVLDFDKSAVELERQIRAYVGWPGSQTTINDLNIKILEAKIDNQIYPNHKPGDLIVEKERLLFKTSKANLEIEKLQPAGKNAMDTKAFLAGYRSKITTE